MPRSQSKPLKRHQTPKRVPRAAFKSLVRWAPIVSVDLILLNRANEVLLGYRSNRPAKNTWFVPGGRIFKGERIPDAMVRIARVETGIGIRPSQAEFVGVFEHFYRNSVFSASRSLPTHYVVLAFKVRFGKDPKLHPDSQHKELRWFSPADLLRSRAVHGNTKAYFRGHRSAD
jgi:colanic acid biosynthesis protein WcaH